MADKPDKKSVEKETHKKMSARFSKELVSLKDSLLQSRQEGRFEDEKEGIQDRVLDVAKRMLREMLELPPSYTYEEIETYVSASKLLDEEGKTHARIISSLLSDTEFSPRPEYERIESIIEGLMSFTEWAAGYVPGKGSVKKKKKSRLLSGIWYLVKGATFIFWFPFYWFITSIRRFSEKNRITDDPSYPIKKELAKAKKHHSRKDMKKAIEAYEKVRDLYSKSPAEVKALVRPDILALHEDIMSDYKSMSSKK
jgi:hypothetical protein